MNTSGLFDYFERLAREHPAILHGKTEKAQFYVIDDAYDFDELDNALRNRLALPAMLIDEPDGYLSENDSANPIDTLNFTMMIIDKRQDNERPRDVRARCKDIGQQIVSSIRKDRFTGILPDKLVTYELQSDYSPVGPIYLNYFGYQFTLSFIIPYSY